MPEGPSIHILKEEVQKFTGKKVLEAYGNGKIDYDRIQGKKVMRFEVWGKQFFVCFPKFYVRVHFLLFGKYSIDESRAIPARLSLRFSNGELHFYTSGIKIAEGRPEDDHDLASDVMSDSWDPAKAKEKLRSFRSLKVCDALMNQEIFSGVGNIIKNEVLFRIKLHPLSDVRKVPAKQLNELVKEARKYSFDFYNWKKKDVLKKHWQIYKKEICPRCKIPARSKVLGKSKRNTYWCEKCQLKY
jgi:endonuclease VIII